MSGGGQIKNVLTLDVTKFNEAIDKATANLGSLDKHLESAGKMAAKFEKGFGSMSGDVAGMADKFKLLDKSISALVSRLDGASSNSLGGFSSKAKQAKKDINELSTATKSAGGTLLNLTDWFGRYGEAVAKINPVVHEVIDAQRKLSASTKTAAIDAKAASVEQIEARMAQLKAERKANADTVSSRSKMVSDLKALDGQMASQQAQLERNAGRFFGKNSGKGDAYRSRAAQIGEERAVIAAQLRQIEGVNEALRYENVQIQQGIDLLRQDLDLRKKILAQEERAASIEGAATAKQIRDLERRKELLNYIAQEEKRIAEESLKVGRQAQRYVDQNARGGYRNAGPKWWEQQLVAQERERELRRRQAAEEATNEARAKKKAERVAAGLTQDAYRPAGAAWWEKELAGRERTEKAAADTAIREAARAQRARTRMMEAEASEARRVARERVASEREAARQIAEMWKGMGQLWGAAKVGQGFRFGLDEASKYQQADFRVKALNLPGAEAEEFRRKSRELSMQEGYLSETEALKARTDAVTAMGHNDPKMIDATLPSAVRNAQVMLAGGYESGERSDLIKNLYGFAEARQVMSDPDKVKESFDIARRLGMASGGKINIADLETVARNMGDLRQSMNADGWLGVASLMEQFKVAGSTGAGGAGAGVSSVGTMLKMMSLYAAGKPVTNQAAMQLLGANVMNDAYAGGSMEDFKQSANNNAMFSRMVKTAGFKGVKEMSANPVEFFSGLRGQMLAYTKDEKNKKQFYGDGETDSKQAESAALKQFFAKMGMSNKTVDGMLLMMDEGFIERSRHVQQMAKDVLDEEQSIEEMRKTWANSVNEMEAGASRLATAFTPLLEPLSAIPRALGALMTKAAQFAQENPLQGMAALAAVAVGGLTLAIKGVATTFGVVGGLAQGFGRILSAGGAEAASAATRVGALESSAGALGNAFKSIGAKLMAPFAALSAGLTGAATKLGSFLSFAVGGLLKLVSWVGWGHLAWTFGWVVGEWISSMKLGQNTIADHVQNIFLNFEVGWKNTILNAKALWNDFMTFLDGGIGQQARDKELSAERAKLAEYKRSMFIGPREGEKTPKGDGKKGDGHGAGHGESKTDGPPVPPPLDMTGLFDKPKKTSERGVFENALARQFYTADARANIEQLKLSSLESGAANFQERARQEVIKLWAGGDLDDGKDARKRRFVKGASYDKDGVATLGGKGYDPMAGWGTDQMDWQTAFSIGGGQSKSLTDLQAEIAKRLELIETVKAVTFAKERAAGSDADLADATARLTEDTLGQTDAMKALNREFAKQEARSPGIQNNADYADFKSKAISGRAGADYRNMGADLVDRNRQLAAQFLATDRERIQAAADAQYEAERKKVDAVRNSLDSQLKLLRTNGKESTQEYSDLVASRESAETQFDQFLINLQKQREEALLSPIQRLGKEWDDHYKAIEQAQASWASSFVEQTSSALSGGKFQWRDFVRNILEDLAKISLKKALALGADSMFGGAGAAGVAKGVMGGAVTDGGLVGGMLNRANGYSMEYSLGANGGPQLPEGAKELGAQLTGAADAAQALQVAQASQTAATAASTVATQTKTATDIIDTAVTEAGTTASIVNTASEWEEVFANRASAISELAANGAAFDGAASFFANGGAFTNKVVGTPTAFGFGHGSLGVMGEAGPEAIMPLSRDGSGRLGVSVHNGGSGGGAAVTIQINVDNSGNTSVAASGESQNDWKGMANRVRSVVIEELANQQRPGGTLYR